MISESEIWKIWVAICVWCFLLIILSFSWSEKRELPYCHSQESNSANTQKATQHPGTNCQWWHTVARKQTWNWDSMSATITDGADYVGVARCDWLLVNVQQTEMLQEGVSHAGIQLLALDKGVRQRHHLWVAPDASYSDRENVVSRVKSVMNTLLPTPPVNTNWLSVLISAAVMNDVEQQCFYVLRGKGRDKKNGSMSPQILTVQSQQRKNIEYIYIDLTLNTAWRGHEPLHDDI